MVHDRREAPHELAFLQPANRLDQSIRRRCAKALRHGRSAEHANRAHARAMRHLNIFGSIADIDAHRGSDAKPLQRHSQRSGMRLSPRRVFAAHFRLKHVRHSVFAQLATDTGAVSTGNQSDPESALHRAQHSQRARLQLRLMVAVELHPQAIRFFPFRSRQSHGAVHTVPVRRIVLFQQVHAPRQSERAKHVCIRLRIGFKRIEQSAVPIEQHAFG